MKINLGCGGIKWDGWIGIDSHPTAATDIVADAKSIPLSDSSVEAVAMIHVLEHFHPADVMNVLNEVSRVLKLRGMFLLEGPDILKCFIEYGDQEDLLAASLYGQAKIGCEADLHKWGYSGETVRRLLKNIGFESVAVSEGKLHCRRKRDYRIVGIKP